MPHEGGLSSTFPRLQPGQGERELPTAPLLGGRGLSCVWDSLEDTGPGRVDSGCEPVILHSRHYAIGSLNASLVISPSRR